LAETCSGEIIMDLKVSEFLQIAGTKIEEAADKGDKVECRRLVDVLIDALNEIKKQIPE
jgi:hypothetical protein